jgi:hypothetical protein
LEKNHKKKKNSILISLDIQSYYYSVKFDFNLEKIFKSENLVNQLADLTDLMKVIYINYFSLIKPFRHGFDEYDDCYPLPIGLFSSMLIGNIYLSGFDKIVESSNRCCYYGRYVDDLLLCFLSDDDSPRGKAQLLHDTLISKSIINSFDNEYSLVNFPNLKIQQEKIKVLFISSGESRAIIDIYNKTIRILPSQVNVVPDIDLQIPDFDLSIYSISNFDKYSKLRDIGFMNIDAFKLSRYFSNLVLRQKNIHSYGNRKNSEQKIIDEQIRKISEFNKKGYAIGFYTTWMNYMYFLILGRRYYDLDKFYNDTKNKISSLSGKNISTIFKQRHFLGKKIQEMLNRHLDVCLATALSIDIGEHIKYYSLLSAIPMASKIMHANMFNHHLIALPLSNYFEYAQNISYTKMDINNYGKLEKGFSHTFKVKWSPRFIHYDELLLALFFHSHNCSEVRNAKNYTHQELSDVFFYINNMNKAYNNVKPNSKQKRIDKYYLEKIDIPPLIHTKTKMDRFSIAIGNIKLEENDCVSVLENRWNTLTTDKKIELSEMMREAFDGNSENKANLFVLPELYVPIYWLEDLIKFSKNSQIAIVTGLQYVRAGENQVKNYLAAIFPFFDANAHKNAFVYIREKNDYSPIEKEALAKSSFVCCDAKTPQYQIFNWNNINIAAFLCYEFTDIFARALLKGQCDIIAAPEFNKDTTYFSNIIDTTVRDLHVIIAQANTSIFGDSRITGPYDRDNKDIVKIKGDENNHVLMGMVDLKAIMKYQSNYNKELEKKLEPLKKENGVTTGKKVEKPEIKKLPARFQNSRTKRRK